MIKFARLVAPALIATIGLGAATSATAQEGPRHEASRYDDSRHGDSRYGDNRYSDGRYGDGRYTPARNAHIRSEINGLRMQIDRAAARRTISPREATGLRRDAASLQRLYANYVRGGLTGQETRILQSRIDRVQVALRAERRDHDRRRG